MKRRNKFNRFFIAILSVLIILSFLSIMGWANEEESTGTYGLWSLVPPILAIILCIILREALISLLIAVLVGATILHNGNLWSGLEKTANILVAQVADSWNASIILFFFLVGGLMGMIFFSGGGQGFLESISKKAHNAKRAQIFSWLGGIVIFIDDYANSAFIGNLFRPLSDKYHVSREKLSYIVDSTAAPVSSIFLISTWIGYQVGLIGDSLPAGIEVSPYFLWLQSIPYSFYSIFAIVMVGIIVYTGRDFGPMLKAEYRARTTHELWAKEARPLAGTSELKVAQKALPKSINLWLPILLLVILSFYFMWASGGGSSAESFSQAISDADAMFSILLATLISFLVAMILYLAQKIASVAEIMDSFLNGARMMVYATLILISAWAIKGVCDELGTAPFIVNALAGVLSPLILPILTFIISAFIAICTGTSWGTMGIVVPIVIPLGVSVGVSLPLVISSVLTGAVMGDHCSPISDTTVMSSTFAGSDHIDHVRTQFPYALTAALIAVICYLLAGFGIPVIIVLVIGIVLLYLMVYILSSISAKQLGITFPLEKAVSSKK
ncbi:MAG: Na+/H+ antiporter NhaC [candidate division TA06 bacterium 34_109]|uniref:Na+/H+ antiporter NhaC n=1 Tax=candidate division TA06 bacterium 34_109 TaxID=1635277 RepID=A0A101I186_UNCT6|nr:MAG: Na+/H+ antiporter NhaC [candidate division TA06 bacterium 34_109]